MTPALMIQGTGSDVGKSLIVAGLARAYAKRSLSVRPFKPQNMSNNAAVAVDGGEIGRAQALQARACGVAPSVHMNPVLLKPETDTGAQVIVRGKRDATLSAREYMTARETYLPAILESFDRLSAEADLVLIEGAGSPAETNLRHRDIANMGFAHAADVPVVLVGDIHRGGVIASIVGTFEVISPEDADRIAAFLINKFHGDTSLFAEGVQTIADRTGRACAGVIPNFADAYRLPAEDAVALDGEIGPHEEGAIDVVVPRLSRIANFDDLDPLRQTPGVNVRIVQAGNSLPGDADLVLLPGSKSTIGDLAFLRAQGWDIDILAHARRGGRILGLCGGYQMLGRKVHDPDGIEGPSGSIEALGLLDIETTLVADKSLENVKAVHVPTGTALTGYEIHLGQSEGPDCARPFAKIGDHEDGARSSDGRIEGTYLHGVFTSDVFRAAYLKNLGASDTQNFAYDATVDETLDALGAHMEQHVDLDMLLDVAGRRSGIVSRRKAV
ncbi:MAG: cobyric acid synthase [Hyphomicrobiaceae bacterium]|nr:cobyric acid synthase [Hyphomicrobiaceae bacterium]